MDIAHLPDLHPHPDRGSLIWGGMEDVSVLHISEHRVNFRLAYKLDIGLVLG
jgi:hypothetical protein